MKKYTAGISGLILFASVFFSPVITDIKGVQALETGMKDYHITNPYQTVDWDTYGQYKANFHSHTTESDGGHSPKDMIEDHYKKGYDVLAITDHSFTSTTWDRKDRNPAHYLTSERLAEIEAGTDRDGRGMIGIPFSNEQSISAHLNTFWANFNNEKGATLESKIAQCEKLGGISHINHPGRSTGASRKLFDVGAAISSDPKIVKRYVDLFMKYPSCVGMEIINKKDDSESDRILWDNILMSTMPDRPVWGFSNDDTHSKGATGFSYNIMLMPENSLGNVRYSMENGTFYAVALISKRELGVDFKASGPAPVINNIVVDQNENTITITAQNFDIVEWVADNKIIATGNSINLNNYENNINNYIRAQIKGSGGISFTQPFGIRTVETTLRGSEGDSSAMRFFDIRRHWAKKHAEILIKRGVLTGYPDNTLRPEAEVTRAEGVVMLVNTMGYGIPEGLSISFDDEENIPQWAMNYVKTAIQKGLLEGYEDNTFRATNKLTRGEMAVLIMKTFGYGQSDTEKLEFADNKNIPDWAFGYVAAAYQKGIVSGYPDNTFRPDKKVTRGEVFAMIAKCLERSDLGNNQVIN